MSYIYTEVTESAFVRAFADAGRGYNFSVGARRALYDWYREYATTLGEPVELDVVAVCVEWMELDRNEIVAEFGTAGADDEDEDAALADALDNLEDYIVVDQIGEPDTYLVRNY